MRAWYSWYMESSGPFSCLRSTEMSLAMARTCACHLVLTASVSSRASSSSSPVMAMWSRGGRRSRLPSFTDCLWSPVHRPVSSMRR